MELTDLLPSYGFTLEDLREDLEANDLVANETAKFATMFQSLMDGTGLNEEKANEAIQSGLEGRLGEFASMEGLVDSAWRTLKQLVARIISLLADIGKRA